MVETANVGAIQIEAAANAMPAFPSVFSSDRKAFVAVESDRRMEAFRRAREHAGETMVMTGEWIFDGRRHHARYVDASGRGLWFDGADKASAGQPPARRAGHVEVRFTDGSRR